MTPQLIVQFRDTIQRVEKGDKGVKELNRMLRHASREFQISMIGLVKKYRGVLIWDVERQKVLLDPNFIPPTNRPKTSCRVRSHKRRKDNYGTF